MSSTMIDCEERTPHSTLSGLHILDRAGRVAVPLMGPAHLKLAAFVSHADHRVGSKRASEGLAPERIYAATK
jgi:hypothetical protein